MLKKLSILTLLISLTIPISTFAASFNAGYFGTTTETNFMAADGTNHDDYWLTLTVEGAGNGKVLWYGSGGSSAGPIGTSAVPATVNAPDGAMWFKLVSDGGEIHATYATSTNPASTEVYFDDGGNSSGGGSDGGSSGGGGDNSCTITNSCDVFECPNWDEYMGKVDQIIAKIPSEPNWQKVAETFRDTIAPRVKADMTDVINDTLGRAPSLPNAPAALDGIDDRGITEPTGKEADGLGDSTFSSDDIKNGAEDIEVREDDSGGFNIENPLETIEDPPINVPKEEENNAPTPDEGDNEAPTPKEDENQAPAPDEPENAAPEPEEPENEAPAPNEPENEAPTPNEQDNSAPTPSEDNVNAPMPSDSDWQAPMPGDENWQAPMPSNNSFNMPIPSS